MLRVFAKFDDEERALSAAGALLDHGVEAEELDLIGSPELKARLEGLTTTTAADAVRGATQGGTAGLALGALAGLASLIIPGYGIVIGSGALATAAAAALGTGAAGLLTGGVAGYLQDMGVDEPIARDFQDSVKNGASLILIETKSPEKENEIIGLLNKYRVDRLQLASLSIK
jgi:uncharacterized membrane protein